MEMDTYTMKEKEEKKRSKIQKLDFLFVRQISSRVLQMNKLSWDGSNFMIQAGRPTFHSLVNSDFEVSHYFRPHLPIEADG